MPQVSVSVSPVLVVAANPNRTGMIINNVGSSTIYFGPSGSIDTTYPSIVPGGTFTEDSGGTKMYCGPIYAVTASGSSSVNYWERALKE